MTSPTEYRPLRILLGTDTFVPDINGAATFTRNLAIGLALRGHDVHVMCPAQPHGDGTFSETHDGAQLTVHRIKSISTPFHPTLRFMQPWKIGRESDRVVREVGPDAIHFQSHVLAGRGLMRAAERHGIRTVGTNHLMPENALHHVRGLPKALVPAVASQQKHAVAALFGRADAITTPTRRAAEYFTEETGLTNVLAVSCGIDASSYSADLSPREHHRLAFLGRLDQEKHIGELVEAAARLKDLDVSVVIIGEGEEREPLAKRAAELGIADRVEFTGRVSDAEVRRTLTASSIFVMPSRAELQSIATMEALASGLPVVAADAMALPHLVHDGENGFLYPPGDIDALEASLRRLLALPQADLLALRRAAMQTVVCHDIQRTLDTFEALYRGEQPPVTDLDADGLSSSA